MVKARFPNSHSQVEEKFAALKTSMGSVANRLDKLDATVARQGHATQQLMKSVNSSDDADVGSDEISHGHIDEGPENSADGSRWWSSQHQLWAATTDTTATTATTKLKYPLRSEQTVWSRESNYSTSLER